MNKYSLGFYVVPKGYPFGDDNPGIGENKSLELYFSVNFLPRFGKSWEGIPEFKEGKDFKIIEVREVNT